MQVIRYSLGELQANCYFLIDADKCIIVDPADDASFILEEIQRRNLKLIAMLATHGHFDHVMAAGEIQLSLKVPLYIDKNDLFLIKRLRETAKYFLGYEPEIVAPREIKYFKKGNFKIENFKLQIISVPGHTPGSFCFYFPKEKIIFTGDTLFKDGVGRTDFSYGNKDDLRGSLDELFKLPETTTIYPGHGDATEVFRARFLVSPSPRR